MKNTILPSVSSQLYSYGSIEPDVSDIPVQMDTSKLNAYGSSLCTDAEIYDNWLRDEGFAVPPQSTLNYQPGPSSSMTIRRLDYPDLGAGYLPRGSSFDNIPQQQPLSVSKKVSVPEYGTNSLATNARKRSIEVSDRGFNNLVDNKAALREWTKNKKKDVCFQEQWHHQVKEELRDIQQQRVQVRRSQKLSDRITALQKLVSPYGKTDTASVLQEASISIRVLHDQIQNLFRTLSESYTSTRPLDLQKSGEKQLDLRSRGLCLVPVSFTQKLEKEDQVDQHATS